MNINTDRLCRLLGSEEAAQKFVTLFLQQLPGQLEDLQQAISAKDWASAGNLAHGLKSQCRYMSLDAAADLLEQIESTPSAQPQSSLQILHNLLHHS